MKPKEIFSIVGSLRYGRTAKKKEQLFSKRVEDPMTYFYLILVLYPL